VEKVESKLSLIFILVPFKLMDEFAIVV